MQEGPDPGQLKKLEERINTLKQANQPAPKVEDHYSAASQGWRMVIELVSGLGLGFAIGYGLDVLFGTLPLFLIGFTLLGFAAGVNVMLKTAREVQDKNVAEASAKGEGE